MAILPEKRLTIMLNHLFKGEVIEHNSFRYGMDQNCEIGFVFNQDGIDCLMGDRLTFGQIYKLAQELPEDMIYLMAITNVSFKGGKDE